MKENKLKKVAPAQGAEPLEKVPENVLLRTRKGLVADLRTARVVTHIVASNEDVQKVIIHVLQKDLKNVPTPEVIQQDCAMASALLRLIMENQIMLDNLAEIIQGLQENYLNKQEFKDLVETLKTAK